MGLQRLMMLTIEALVLDGLSYSAKGPTMKELILRHYDFSNYAEEARAALG
jgi:hypothetical protein